VGTVTGSHDQLLTNHRRRPALVVAPVTRADGGRSAQRERTPACRSTNSALAAGLERERFRIRTLAIKLGWHPT
jgi:hypothetical protein